MFILKTNRVSYFLNASTESGKIKGIFSVNVLNIIYQGA